jgi:two-component system chemotaxis response regulator CheB
MSFRPLRREGTRRNAEISLRALQLGASDYVAKPEGGLGSAGEFRRDLVAKVKAFGPRPQTLATSPIVSGPTTPLVDPRLVEIAGLQQKRGHPRIRAAR